MCFADCLAITRSFLSTENPNLSASRSVCVGRLPGRVIGPSLTDAARYVCVPAFPSPIALS